MLSTLSIFKTGPLLGSVCLLFEGNYLLLLFCIIACHLPNIPRLTSTHQFIPRTADLARRNDVKDVTRWKQTERERERSEWGEKALGVGFPSFFFFLQCSYHPKRFGCWTPWEWDSTNKYFSDVFMRSSDKSYWFYINSLWNMFIWREVQKDSFYFYTWEYISGPVLSYLYLSKDVKSVPLLQ